MQHIDVLFALVRAGITGEPVSTEVQEACTEEMLVKVYTEAKRHGLVQIVGQTVSTMSLPEWEVIKAFRACVMHAVYKSNQMEYEYTRMCRVLEGNKIPYIPLKGAVMRPYYPQPWMRTSSDIDILVKPAELEKAAGLLQEQLKYEFHDKGTHDITLICPNKVVLELHYRTTEYWGKAENVLLGLWDDAVPVEPGKYQHKMSGEMFYFYHFAHMAKHAAIGGSFVRSFVDLWFMEKYIPCDKTKLKKLLVEGGWWKYYQAADKLYRAWLYGETKSLHTQAFEAFVLEGCSQRVKVLLGQQKQGGRFRYILQRIFLPYESLKTMFPVLEKAKWLIPVCQVLRWFKLLFFGGVKRSLSELRTNATVSQESQNEMIQLMDYLGIRVSESRLNQLDLGGVEKNQ